MESEAARRAKESLDLVFEMSNLLDSGLDCLGATSNDTYTALFFSYFKFIYVIHRLLVVILKAFFWGGRGWCFKSVV